MDLMHFLCKYPFALQRYEKKSECTRKIYFYLSFAGFFDCNFGEFLIYKGVPKLQKKMT